MKLKYYSAPWCSTCKAFLPTVEAVCKQEGIDMIYIDVSVNGFDENTKDIARLPTIELIGDNGKMIDFRSGAISKLDLVKMIRGHK